MSAKTNSDSGEAMREHVEANYSLRVFPNAEWAEEMLDDEDSFPQEHGDGQTTAILRHVADVLAAQTGTDYDPYSTKERTRTQYVVTLGDEEFDDFDRTLFNEMARAVANADNVSGLQFDEVEETNVKWSHSPGYVFGHVLTNLVDDAFGEKVELIDGDESYTFYRDGKRWETGDDDQFFKLSKPYNAAQYRSHPDDSIRVESPSFSINMKAKADAEAAVDELDAEIGNALLDALNTLDLGTTQTGTERSLTVEVGDVEKEVCKRSA